MTRGYRYLMIFIRMFSTLMYILYVFSCWIRTTDETIIYMMFNQQQYAENIDNRWFFMLRIVIIMFFCPCSLGSNSVLPDPALSNLARIKRNDVGELNTFQVPYAPCMVYLYTYKTGLFLGQMLVNIAYMEHMGLFYMISEVAETVTFGQPFV